MRVLALNLPQFHEVAENNEWWGKGFTEWTNVKKAKPLYKGHVQPMVPLEGYYDLSEVDAIAHQAELARRYGVYGFVYFHYWYEGRKMLEKPCELLLANPQIDVNYCFCWANHSWTRAWDGKEQQVLLEQTYGGEADWKNHIDYLLPFFRDERYIKKDNRPMLFIYNSSVIPDVNGMIAFWEEVLRREGFDGLYIVEYISTKCTKPYISSSRAVYEDEPLYSLRFETNPVQKAYRVIQKKRKRTEYQDYDKIYKMLLRKKRTYGQREIIQGAFPAWDNTPRRGSRGAMVVKGADPEKFETYFSRLCRCERQGASKEYIVVNAWNEWGEGAVLEPSELFGYRYLEAIKRITEA